MNGRKWLRAAGASAIVLLSLLVLTVVFAGQAAQVDFICYWSSARLLDAHQDPYAPQAVLQLEKAAGSTVREPALMRNPPWALFLVAPIGLFRSIPVAVFFWLVAMLGSAVLSIRLLSAGSKPPPLTAYLFAPILYCAMAGQAAMFLLLGVAVLFHFYKSRPWLAGLALTLPAIKPHLLLLVWPILLADCLRNRRWKILAGGVAGVAAATAFALAFDPHVLTDYVAAMRADHIEFQYLPNLACTLRFLAPSKPLWVQAAPIALAAGWAAWFYWKRRAIWEWPRDGALVLAVSVLVSPYTWPFDQVLFLPAILFAYAGPIPKRIVQALAVLSGIAAVMVLKFSLMSPVFLWTGPAWFAWYLWARQKAPAPVPSEPVMAAS